MKPTACPFCGNDDPTPGIVKPCRTKQAVWAAYTYCDVCHCVGPKVFYLKAPGKRAARADSIKAWNERASPSTTRKKP